MGLKALSYLLRSKLKSLGEGLLQKMGYKTFGIDLNPAMVKFAKAHYPEIHFEIRDMRKLTYKGKFDAIICLCTTFSYNVSNKDIIRSLKGFYNSLKANGILVIETFNPISFLQKLRFDGSFFLEKEEVFNKLGLRSQVLHTVNEREQTMTEIKTFFRLKGNKKLKTDVTTYRLFFPQEMQFFLGQTGFKFIDLFGNYNKAYKNPDATKLIVVAKK